MAGFIDDIEDLTEDNTYFRKVIHTEQHMQLVLMSLKPREEIGMEVHETVDQFLRIESGHGKVVMNGEEHELHEDDAIIVPAGTEHNVINTSETEPMKLYTVYAPPHHKDGTVHMTKEDAEKDTEDHM